MAIFLACGRLVMVTLGGSGSPMSSSICLNSSRSSAILMVSMEVPRVFTLYFSNTPASAKSTARLSPVWPPRVGSRPSGRSFSMMRLTISTVSGSM